MVLFVCFISLVVFFKQKTAYDMRISDWSSDVCSSDLNDLNSGTDVVEGAAFIDGGSISLEAAPRVSLAIDARESIDISGSILIRPGARLDVSGGGYVAPDGAVDASATGGDVRLVSQANYFQLSPIPAPGLENPGNVPGIREIGRAHAELQSLMRISSAVFCLQ